MLLLKTIIAFNLLYGCYYQPVKAFGAEVNTSQSGNCFIDDFELEFSQHRLPTTIAYDILLDLVEQPIVNCSSNVPFLEFTALFDLFISTDGPHWNWFPDSRRSIWNFKSFNSTSYPNPCAEG